MWETQVDDIIKRLFGKNFKEEWREKKHNTTCECGEEESLYMFIHDGYSWEARKSIITSKICRLLLFFKHHCSDYNFFCALSFPGSFRIYDIEREWEVGAEKCRRCSLLPVPPPLPPFFPFEEYMKYFWCFSLPFETSSLSLSVSPSFSHSHFMSYKFWSGKMKRGIRTENAPAYSIPNISPNFSEKKHERIKWEEGIYLRTMSKGGEKDHFEGLLVFFYILTIISITKRLKIFQKPPIEWKMSEKSDGRNICDRCSAKDIWMMWAGWRWRKQARKGSNTEICCRGDNKFGGIVISLEWGLVKMFGILMKNFFELLLKRKVKKKSIFFKFLSINVRIYLLSIWT